MGTVRTQKAGTNVSHPITTLMDISGMSMH
jgi:hypothetical protein